MRISTNLGFFLLSFCGANTIVHSAFYSYCWGFFRKNIFFNLKKLSVSFQRILLLLTLCYNVYFTLFNLVSKNEDKFAFAVSDSRYFTTHLRKNLLFFDYWIPGALLAPLSLHTYYQPAFQNGANMMPKIHQQPSVGIIIGLIKYYRISQELASLNNINITIAEPFFRNKKTLCFDYFIPANTKLPLNSFCFSFFFFHIASYFRNFYQLVKKTIYQQQLSVVVKKKPKYFIFNKKYNNLVRQVYKTSVSFNILIKRLFFFLINFFLTNQSQNYPTLLFFQKNLFSFIPQFSNNIISLFPSQFFNLFFILYTKRLILPVYFKNTYIFSKSSISYSFLKSNTFFINSDFLFNINYFLPFLKFNKNFGLVFLKSFVKKLLKISFTINKFFSIISYQFTYFFVFFKKFLNLFYFTDFKKTANSAFSNFMDNVAVFNLLTTKLSSLNFVAIQNLFSFSSNFLLRRSFSLNSVYIFNVFFKKIFISFRSLSFNLPYSFFTKYFIFLYNSILNISQNSFFKKFLLFFKIYIRYRFFFSWYLSNTVKKNVSKYLFKSLRFIYSSFYNLKQKIYCYPFILFFHKFSNTRLLITRNKFVNFVSASFKKRIKNNTRVSWLPLYSFWTLSYFKQLKQPFSIKTKQFSLFNVYSLKKNIFTSLLDNQFLITKKLYFRFFSFFKYLGFSKLNYSFSLLFSNKYCNPFFFKMFNRFFFFYIFRFYYYFVSLYTKKYRNINNTKLMEFKNLFFNINARKKFYTRQFHFLLKNQIKNKELRNIFFKNSNIYKKSACSSLLVSSKKKKNNIDNRLQSNMFKVSFIKKPSVKKKTLVKIVKNSLPSFSLISKKKSFSHKIIPGVFVSPKRLILRNSFFTYDSRFCSLFFYSNLMFSSKKLVFLKKLNRLSIFNFKFNKSKASFKKLKFQKFIFLKNVKTLLNLKLKILKFLLFPRKLYNFFFNNFFLTTYNVKVQSFMLLSSNKLIKYSFFSSYLIKFNKFLLIFFSLLRFFSKIAKINKILLNFLNFLFTIYTKIFQNINYLVKYSYLQSFSYYSEFLMYLRNYKFFLSSLCSTKSDFFLINNSRLLFSKLNWYFIDIPFYFSKISSCTLNLSSLFLNNFLLKKKNFYSLYLFPSNFFLTSKFFNFSSRISIFYYTYFFSIFRKFIFEKFFIFYKFYFKFLNYVSYKISFFIYSFFFFTFVKKNLITSKILFTLSQLKKKKKITYFRQSSFFFFKYVYTFRQKSNNFFFKLKKIKYFKNLIKKSNVLKASSDFFFRKLLLRFIFFFRNLYFYYLRFRFFFSKLRKTFRNYSSFFFIQKSFDALKFNFYNFFFLSNFNFFRNLDKNLPFFFF